MSNRRYTMAVDYGDGMVRQFAWITTEELARRYFAREVARNFCGYSCTLLDGTARILASV
jgi:hypothetical protein